MCAAVLVLAGDKVSVGLVVTNTGTMRLSVVLSATPRVSAALQCNANAAMGATVTVDPGSATAINCFGLLEVCLLGCHCVRACSLCASMSLHSRVCKQCCFGALWPLHF